MIRSVGFLQETPIVVDPRGDDEQERRGASVACAEAAIRGGWEHDLALVLDMLGLREQT